MERLIANFLQLAQSDGGRLEADISDVSATDLIAAAASQVLTRPDLPQLASEVTPPELVLHVDRD